MSKLFIILLILVLTSSVLADINRYDNRTIISDQGGFQHAIIGATWGTYAKKHSVPLVSSLVMTLGLSIMKECLDEDRGSKFSALDIMYAMMGTYISWNLVI